jgi:hypothetical protein
LDGANDTHFGKLVSDPVDSKGDVHQDRATSTTVNIHQEAKGRKGQ